MALTTSAWGRPIQGVSQQPPKNRLEGQCSVQKNAVSSVVSGLVKRPGTHRISSLMGEQDHTTAYYYYNRGDGERYFVVVPPNSLPRVFDIEGDELVVENTLADDSYVRSANPARWLRFSTISDYTFITDRGVIPKKGTEKTPPLENKATIEIRYATYGRKYSITLDGESTRFQTPDGAKAWHSNQVSTDYVASVLYTGNYGGSDGGASGPGVSNVAGFSTELVGNTLYVKKDDGSDFSISSTDGADGGDIIIVKNSVTKVTDLPKMAVLGTMVEVIGDSSSTTDNYWLKADSKSGDTIKWIESSGPDQVKGFDKKTMPHVLVRDRFENGKAVFKIEEGPWEDRAVGTDKSNGFPSFVKESTPISSVGTFQNRLYLTAGESIVYSRSNEFFDLFRRSVRTALEDDPIDVYADTRKINTIENSAVLDGDVVFFSATGQFLQAGKEPITKENATLQNASTFENEVSCKPKPSGDVIFFAFKYGRYAGVREFYTDSFTDTKRARPITDHVDEYLEGPPKLLATSTNKNQLLVLTYDSDLVYVYNWLWQGQERVQSSWSSWDLGGKVEFVEYDDDIIYFIINRYGSLELEFLETGDPDDEGLDFPVRLDSKVQIEASRAGSVWEATLPYYFEEGSLTVVRGKGCLDIGVSVEFVRKGNKITTTDELSEGYSATLVAGFHYNMVYEPTMPFVKDRGGKVIDTDRLIINDVNINYDMTGLFFVYVENRWGSQREYSFNGRKVGDISNIVGFSPLRPGQFTFPVRQESDRCTFTIETESHIPFQLRGMEWRGRFTQRGRRV